MGKMKENPRYNIVSTRISDADLAELARIRNGRSAAEVLQAALSELIIRARQQQFDDHLQGAEL